MRAPLPQSPAKVTSVFKTLAIQENGVSHDVRNFGEKIMTAATSNAEPVGKEKLKGVQLLKVAFRNRKTAVMLFFGFSAGLPYTLLLGTLNAWLGEAKVSLATIGILSWIGLAYAFKFLWSPLVDRIYPPVLSKLGRRRSWLLLCQVVLALTFVVLSRIDPVVSIGTFAIIAVIAAFFSATQDVVIDAWRIDVADQNTPVDVLSTIYQFGYRIAALIGGALALIFAARVSWPTVYLVLGLVMGLTVIATMIAPDTKASEATERQTNALAKAGAILPKYRSIALAVVGICWVWAIYTIGAFMTAILMASPDDPNKPIAGDFVKHVGPWIVIATVIIPAAVAATINYLALKKDGILKQDLPSVSGSQKFVDHIYSALVAPLADIVKRLGWGSLIVLCLILSYRICDSIWGPFAFPFYLEELKYTNDEVAFASKMFGVIMTILGISAGGLMLVWLGRMPTLVICAIVAASSNLLYADLANGGHYIDMVANGLGINALAESLGYDARMTRLLVAISGENIASGMAGAAFIAYLSSITSKEYSAVQYALLSSLTFLVGSLGRGALGEQIEIVGYAPVFVFTAAIGGVAVIFSLLEWWRQSRYGDGSGTVVD